MKIVKVKVIVFKFCALFSLKDIWLGSFLFINLTITNGGILEFINPPFWKEGPFKHKYEEFLSMT